MIAIPRLRNPRALAMCLALSLAAGVTPSVHAQWELLPVRKQGHPRPELAEGLLFPHCMTRSKSNPNRLYLAHDVGQIWRSNDNGVTWQHAGCKGFFVSGGESVQCDPKNEDVVLALGGNIWDGGRKNDQGIYRSTDGGANWTRVLPVDFVQDQTTGGARYEQQRFAWDPNTESSTLANRKWYCIVNRDDGGTTQDVRLYSSTGGITWSQVGSTLSFATYGRVDFLKHHPSTTGTLFMGTSTGLFKSSNGGISWTPLVGNGDPGNLPAGRVRSIDINPATPTDIYATVDGLGLYRTTDGGQNWSLIKSYPVSRAVVDAQNRDRIFLLGKLQSEGGVKSPMIMTINATAATPNWTTPRLERVDDGVVPAPPYTPDGSWETSISGSMSNVLPDPNHSNIITAHACAQIYRSIDGGATFVRATEGFAGASVNDFWFDPADGDRWGVFITDEGLKFTENGGTWFADRSAAANIDHDSTLDPDKIKHGTMISGDFKPGSNSQTVVTLAGLNGANKFMYSTNEGVTWTVPNADPAGNQLVRYHPTDQNVIYTQKRRFDNGPAGGFVAIDYRFEGFYPGNGNIIFGIDDGSIVYRSNNRGVAGSWSQFATGAKVKPVTWTGAGVLAVHPTNSNVIFTGRPVVDSDGNNIPNVSDLVKFTSGVATNYDILTLTQVTGSPASNSISKIAIDPHNAQIIYVATRGVGQPNLFRTINGGNDWTDVTGNLPRSGVKSIGISPVTSEVYVGTQNCGIYRLVAATPPTNLTATAASSSQINLSWTDNAFNETGFEIDRALNSTFTSGAVTNAYTPGANPAMPFTAGGLAANTTYYFRVRATNANGDSTNSNVASATTLPASNAPTFVASGPIGSAPGSFAPILPSGIQTGDILLLFVETANEASSISNANGGTWAQVASSPQQTGTAGGAGATRLTVFWSRYNGSQLNPQLADSGDHQMARMIAIRGAASSGNPWNVTAGGVESTADTSGSIPGATTTVANTLVVVAVAGSLPDVNGSSNFSAWSNANLTNVTERTDNSRDAGNGGALGVATGVKATAGAYGATTVTLGASASKAMISIAIRP